jgi:hypothetical protein
MVALAITAGELAVRRRSCQERFGANQFGFTRYFLISLIFYLTKSGSAPSFGK